MTVQWCRDKCIAVGNVAELDCVLDAIERETPPERPILADVAHPTGGYLAIGLGGRLSVLTHSPADRDPPYSTSLGEVTRDDPGGDDPIVFFYDGHWSEFSRYQCLVPAVARQAMRDFFSTGQLPQWLEWEEV